MTVLYSGHSPRAFVNFYTRLMKNPSFRSVNATYTFILREQLPIDVDGYVYGYKRIRQDWTDVYSGTVNNKVGANPQLPRNKVSDEAQDACSFGFHVGGWNYVSKFHNEPGSRVIIVRFDPADVVSVATDVSQGKIRVCSYLVVGLHSGKALPNTIIPSVDIPKIESGDVFYLDDTDDEVVGVVDPVVPENPVPDNHSLEKLRILAKSMGIKNIKSFSKEQLLAKINKIRDPPTSIHEVKKQKEEKVSIKEKTREYLQSLSISDLRKEATHKYKIVGASKLPGGKDALIKCILKTL